MPFLRLHRQPDDGDAPADGPLYFTAATAGTKADGIDLAGLPWDLSRGGPGGDGPRYPFLWAHDMAGERLPLGVVDVTTAPDELPLRVAVHFDPGDDFAQRVAAKYRSPVGGLEAVSISWDDVDDAGLPARTSGKKATAHQLLEVSAVPVGLDPLALQEGERAAMRSLLADLQAALARGIDDDDSDHAGRDATATEADVSDDVTTTGERELDEGAWADVAAGMVEALTRSGPETDTARHRAYKRLLPAYRFLGMTPPEWIGGDEIRALDDDNWRALFLSGELEVIADGQRVGAELSSRNVQELTEVHEAVKAAASRLGTLLERVTTKSVGKESVGKDAPADDGDGERILATVDADTLDDVDLAELAAMLEHAAGEPAEETNDE